SPQGMRAVVAELNRLALATATRDRHGARDGLERGCRWKAIAIITDPRQQSSRCQWPLRSRKRQPPVRFRMAQKDLLDLFDECCLLVVQGSQDGYEHLDVFHLPCLHRSTWHGHLQTSVDQIQPVHVVIVLAVKKGFQI